MNSTQQFVVYVCMCISHAPYVTSCQFMSSINNKTDQELSLFCSPALSLSLCMHRLCKVSFEFRLEYWNLLVFIFELLTFDSLALLKIGNSKELKVLLTVAHCCQFGYFVASFANITFFQNFV